MELDIEGYEGSQRCLRVDLAGQGNQDGVINVRASAVRVLDVSDVDLRSHDFH